MKEAPKVAMGIVAYNNVSYTARAVNSLRAQAIPVTIGVWNNASSDGTSQWIDEQDDPHFVGVNSPDNVLWSPAVNSILDKILIRHMNNDEPTPEYIGFMNNDVSLPHPYAIQTMVEHLEANPDIGIIAPVTTMIGGPQDHSHFHKQRKDYPIPVRVAFILGACVLMSRRVWMEVGDLDEDMPLGADDHDYCIRVKDIGYKIAVAQDVFAQHEGHASHRSDEGKRNWEKWGGYSWDCFNHKWAGYFADEDEATKCHWNGNYYEGYDRGTGWHGPRVLSRFDHPLALQDIQQKTNQKLDDFREGWKS